MEHIQQQPLARLKLENLEHHQHGVQMPEVTHACSSVDDALVATIIALGRRRQDLANPVRGDLDPCRIGKPGEPLLTPSGEVRHSHMPIQVQLGLDHKYPSTRTIPPELKR